MSKKKEMTAKDRAFEQERMKYRKEINSLKHEIDNKDKQIKSLSDQVELLENKVNESEDWIQRLLEYCDLDEEFMRNKIEKEKIQQSLEKSISRDINHADGLFNTFNSPFLNLLGSLACLGGPKNND